jgi:hypothetical protein
MVGFHAKQPIHLLRKEDEMQQISALIMSLFFVSSAGFSTGAGGLYFSGLYQSQRVQASQFSRISDTEFDGQGFSNTSSSSSLDPETGTAQQPRLFSKISNANEIGRDDRFIAYANRVVLDTKTGLEWCVAPDKDMTWGEAKSWVENLSIDGGGWRMPAIEELRTLYISGIGTRNMTPLLKTSGWWVWSGERNGSLTAAWNFSFSGGNEHWIPQSNCRLGRGIAVRSRK